MAKKRHACYICGAKRYEQALKPVTVLNLVRGKFSSTKGFVCRPKDWGSLEINACNTKHLTIKITFQDYLNNLSLLKLSADRAKLNETKLSAEDGQFLKPLKFIKYDLITKN